jgi:hypothetical protein
MSPRVPEPQPGVHDTDPIRVPALFGPIRTGLRPDAGIHELRPKTTRSRATAHPAGHQPAQSNNPHTDTPHAGEHNTAPTRTHVQSGTLRAGARPSGGIQTRRTKTAWGRAPGRPAGHQPVRSTNPNIAESQAGEHSTGPARVPALSGTLRTGTRPDGGIQAMPPGTAA